MSDAVHTPKVQDQPEAAKPEEQGGPRKVDEAAQEHAAREREKSGGYD